MNRHEILAEVRNAFSDLPRPVMFIRGTCNCEECLEHEETMQSFTPEALPLDKLDNPGWDPICFASDEAFAYLVPGLVEHVLEHTDDYITQFLYHLENSDRIARFTEEQARALLQVLDFLTLECAEILDINSAVDDLYRVRELLEPIASP